MSFSICAIYCTLSALESKIFIRGPKEINPTFVGLISFWDPATSASPGRSAWASLRPQDAAHAEPNQVRCMHVGWDDLDK